MVRHTRAGAGKSAIVIMVGRSVRPWAVKASGARWTAQGRRGTAPRTSLAATL